MWPRYTGGMGFTGAVGTTGCGAAMNGIRGIAAAAPIPTPIRGRYWCTPGNITGGAIPLPIHII
uniref:Uncharacterized protein n=1 Tax=Oryza brachyantha TaxID=4533 RepID=J3LR13_ORYBR